MPYRTLVNPLTAKASQDLAGSKGGWPARYTGFELVAPHFLATKHEGMTFRAGPRAFVNKPYPFSGSYLDLLLQNLTHALPGPSLRQAHDGRLHNPSRLNLVGIIGRSVSISTVCTNRSTAAPRRRSYNLQADQIEFLAAAGMGEWCLVGAKALSGGAHVGGVFSRSRSQRRRWMPSCIY